MNEDDFWIVRFKDNRIFSLFSQIREMIEDCDSPQELSKIESSLKLGMANFASKRRRELSKGEIE